MSFNDISNISNSRNSSKLNISPTCSLDAQLSHIGDALKKYQMECSVAKQSFDEYKHRVITSHTKTILDNKVRSLKKSEESVKIKLDSYLKSVEGLCRAEAASRRVTCVKLQKDFDRVKSQQTEILKTQSTFRVEKKENNSLSFERIEGDNIGIQKGDIAGMSPVLLQTLEGQDVENAIIEERERDIKKINQDIVLVNEMMKDMAHIVENHGTVIEKVAEDAEISRERAEAGLGQLHQAHSYQPGCCIQ